MPPSPPPSRPSLSDDDKRQLGRRIEQEISKQPHAELFGDGTILRALLPIILRVIEEFLKDRQQQGGQVTAKPG